MALTSSSDPGQAWATSQRMARHCDAAMRVPVSHGIFDGPSGLALPQGPMCIVMHLLRHHLLVFASIIQYKRS